MKIPINNLQSVGNKAVFYFFSSLERLLMCSIKQCAQIFGPLIPHLSKFVLQTEMDTIVLLCELLIELLYSCMKKLLLYLMELLHTLVTNKTKMWRADFNLLIFMR